MVKVFHLDGRYTKGTIIGEQQALTGKIQWIKVLKDNGDVVDINLDNTSHIVHVANENQYE